MGIIQKIVDFLRGAKADESLPFRSVEAEPPTPVIQTSGAVAETPVVAPELPVRAPSTERQPVSRASGVKKAVIAEDSLIILDLRELPSGRFRIVGSSYWVTDSGRYKHGGSDYLLVREPKNKWDVNAVAVYGKGRKVGHLTEAKAAAFAPILDELAFDAYRVGGAPPADNSIRMWVDLPAIPKLRAFVKGLPESGSAQVTKAQAD